MFSKPHDCNFIRVFGCLCYTLRRPYNRHKLDYRFAPCVFLGYYANQHGYMCLDSSGRVYISRHIKFQESVFPFADKHGALMHSSAVKNTVTSEPFFLPFNSTMCNPKDNSFAVPTSHNGN